MINVSLNDLLIGNDLPAPRTASRATETAGFAVLMDEASARLDGADRDTAARERRTRGTVARETGTGDTAQDSTAETTPVSSRRDAPSRRAEQPDSRSHDNSIFESTPAADAGDTAARETPRDSASATGDAAAPDSSTDPAVDAPGLNTIDSTPHALPTSTGDVHDAAHAAAHANITWAVAPSEPGRAQPIGIHAAAVVGPPTVADLTLPAALVNGHAGSVAAPPAAAALSPESTPILPPGKPHGPSSDSLSAVTPVSADAGGAATVAHSQSKASVVPGTVGAGGPMPAASASATATPGENPAPSNPNLQAAALRGVTAPSDDRALAASSVAAAQNGAITQSAALVASNATPAATTPAAAMAAPQQAADLAALLGVERIGIAISQARTAMPDKSASGHLPAPALANGMVAQIGAFAQSLNQTDQPHASVAGLAPDDGLTLAPPVPAQTATAVAVAVAVQTDGQIQPPLAGAPDGLVLNAPAPIGAQMAQPPATEQVMPGKPTGTPTPPAFDQVAVEIAKAAAEGSDKLTIKLRPASLGQIEVQLDVTSDGRVHAVIAADKPETLDLLQRDARALERALNDAGLRADSGSLNFNLRSQGHGFGMQTADGFPGRRQTTGGDGNDDMALPPNAARIGAYLNSRAAVGGLDIRV